MIEETQLFLVCGYSDDGKYRCFLIDPEDGEYEMIPISGAFTESVGDRLYRLEKGTSSVVSFSLSEKAETKIPLNVRGQATSGLTLGSKIIVSPDGTRAVATSSDYMTLLMIDLQKAEAYPIQENIRSKSYFAWSDEGTQYVVGTNTAVYVFTAEGEAVCEISTEGRFLSGIFFEGDDLYVLYNTGNLFRYNLANAYIGNLQAGTEADVAKLGVAADSSSDYELRADGDDLYLQASGERRWLAIIDRQTMELQNLIEGAIDYFPEAGVILTGNWNLSGNEYVVTAFDHYSADQLREKAVAFIGGNKIHPEMKEKYGLQ